MNDLSVDSVCSESLRWWLELGGKMNLSGIINSSMYSQRNAYYSFILSVFSLEKKSFEWKII